MRYEITHSCGHRATADILGTNAHGEREGRADWLASRPCPDCARRQRTAEYQRLNEHAAARGRRAGWAPLEGTDRQTAWAETIRVEKTDELRDALGRVTDRATAEILQLWDRLVIARQTNAAWWIDQQHTRAPRLLVRHCPADTTDHLRTLLEETR
ncbi:hypothetical protein [Streptomyces goshikiensis]|uniref:hypothetical protein n=1 Tax=Streptomyces goshikiensis TaxID=1942 RepID=UPI0036B3BB0C